MKILAIAAILASVSMVPHDADIRVIDGDSVEINGEKIRLAIIDAPEIRNAKCDAERRLGLVAKERLRQILMERPMRIERGDPQDGRMTDRFGRTLAVVYVREKAAGQTLINEYLARPWAGRRQSWCQ